MNTSHSKRAPMYQCEIITTLVGCTHQEKDINLYVVRFGSWGRFPREAPRRRGSVGGGGGGLR